MRLPNGDWIYGDWSNGDYQGNGSYTFADGSTYNGNFDLNNLAQSMAGSGGGGGGSGSGNTQERLDAIRDLQRYVNDVAQSCTENQSSAYDFFNFQKYNRDL
jgi:hypothetical protein